MNMNEQLNLENIHTKRTTARIFEGLKQEKKRMC